MFSAWRVAVVLSATNMTGGAFSSFLSSSYAAHTATSRLQHGIAQFSNAAAEGFAASAAAMGKFVADGIGHAENLQITMTNLYNSLGVAGEDVQRRLQGTALSLSGLTAQNVETIGREMLAAGQAGLNSQQLSGPLFQQIAKFADLAWRSKGENPVEAASSVVQLSHLMGAYDTQSMSDMVEHLNKLTQTTHASLKQVITQGRYFIPEARRLGLSIDDIFMATMYMGQTGFLSGRGGTGIQNTMKAMLNMGRENPRTRTGLEALAAERGLGLINSSGKNMFVDARGNLLLMPMLQHLEQVAQRERPDLYAQQIQAVFKTQPLALIEALTSRPAQEQALRNKQRMASMGSIESMFEELNKTFQQQMTMLKTNWDNILAVTFLPLVEALTPYVHEFAGELQRLAVFLAAHPKLGLLISVSAVVAIGSAITGAVALWIVGKIALVRSMREMAIAANSSAAGMAEAAAAMRAARFGEGVLDEVHYIGMQGVFNIVMNGVFNIAGFGGRGVSAGIVRGRAALAGEAAIALPGGFAGTAEVAGAVGLRAAMRGVVTALLEAPWGLVGTVVAVGAGLIAAVVQFHAHAETVGHVLGKWAATFWYRTLPVILPAINGFFAGMWAAISGGFANLGASSKGLVQTVVSAFLGLPNDVAIAGAAIREEFRSAGVAVSAEKNGLRGPRLHTGPMNVQITFNGVGNAEPHEIARKVVSAINKSHSFMMRAGGGTLNVPRSSVYSQNGILGVPQ